MTEWKKELEEVRDRAIAESYHKEAVVIQNALMEIDRLEDALKKTQMELNLKKEKKEKK